MSLVVHIAVNGEPPLALVAIRRTSCASCPHLRTAHSLPSGLCLLCRCPGWTDRVKTEQEGGE